MQNKRLIGIVVAVATLLLIPLIAMQFTDEVDWKPFDFVVMGILLLSTGLLCELIYQERKKNKVPYHNLWTSPGSAFSCLGRTCGWGFWNSFRRIVRKSE